MSEREPTYCRSCKARVIWAKTERGRMMPVDYEPSDNGNILLQHREGDLPLAVYLNEQERNKLIAALDGRLQRHRLHTSHFATCPNAQQHRRKQ